MPSPAERYRRGVEAYRAGDLAALEAEASALEGVNGYEPHAAMLQGMQSLKQGRLRDAIESFGRATRHTDTQAAAYSLAGESFYRMGRPDDARRALYEAIRLDPDDVDALRWLASACYDLGLMSEALPHLQKLSQLAPDDPRPHRLTGLIQKDLENYTEAVAAYRESLRRGPRQPDADHVRAELAECLIKNLRPDEALEALAPAEDTPVVLTLRAEAESLQGQTQTARELLSRVLEMSPNHSPALMLLGTMELDAGRFNESVQLLERAAATEATDFEVHHKLAQAYRLAGRTTDAERESKRADELRELRVRFADLHERAMKAPQDAQVRFELGTVALTLGRPELAIMWFEAAVSIDGNHTAARTALAGLADRSTRRQTPFAAR
jgi:tetratricopeptide (TPR) repeat protein